MTVTTCNDSVSGFELQHADADGKTFSRIDAGNESFPVDASPSRGSFIASRIKIRERSAGVTHEASNRLSTKPIKVTRGRLRSQSLAVRETSDRLTGCE